MELSKTATTADGQHIHIHIHLSSGEVDATKGLLGREKSKEKGIALNTLLTLVAVLLAIMALNKYGMIRLDWMLSLSNLKVLLNPLVQLPQPPPLTAVSSSPASQTMSQLTGIQRCMSRVSLHLSGYSVPAADSNIQAIPKDVCHAGCTYSVVEREASVGVDEAGMRYVGRFTPTFQECSELSPTEKSETQKTSLLIPLYYGYNSLREFLSGDASKSSEVAPSAETKKQVQVPFLQKKLEEAREKLGKWIWSVTRYVVYLVACVLLLIALLSHSISRLLLILLSVFSMLYVYMTP